MLTGSGTFSFVLPASARPSRVLITRARAPKINSKIGMTRNHLIAPSRTGRPRGRGCDSVLLCGMGCLRRVGVVRLMANDEEDDGDEEQCGYSGKEQTTDHGSPQRRVLLATVTQA